MSTQIDVKNEKSLSGTNKIDERVLSGNEKTTITLEGGKNTTTMQGGVAYPIMFKEILAGEYIKNWEVDILTRLITPLVPTFDRLYIKVQAYFVPLTRIWDEAEKVLAGKQSAEIGENDNYYRSLPSTQIDVSTTGRADFKKLAISRYGISNKAGTTYINPFLVRGYRAIENDFLRIKEYELPKIEWKESEVTEAEGLAINPGTTPFVEGSTYTLAKALGKRNYYTNIKKEMYMDMDGNAVDDFYGRNEHLDWQSRYNDYKQRTLNAEKNDWDIIAEMGGTSPVLADRVQKLGELEYELNYQQITQSAPIIDNGTPLGTAGSFSYTRATGTIFSHKQFQQHGHIHIIASIGMDHIFEDGTPKELLKIASEDIYRPGLANKETQMINRKEITNSPNALDGGIAYQPAWAEYKRLPSFASGEMQTTRLSDESVSNSQWHNMLSLKGNNITIDADYFKMKDQINAVLARNNVENATWTEEGAEFKDDPILQMSQHTVTTSLPIISSVINQTDKANEIK